MLRIIKYIVLFFAFSPWNIFAKIAVGEWRTHFSYSSANQVVLANEMVYVEANGKLFSWNTQNESLKTYTKLDGMNGNSISNIGWCESAKTLIVLYKDGNIDFLKSGKFSNLPDFKNKSLTADKSIHGLSVFDSTALISTGVGLMVVDMQRKEFSDNYYLPFGTSHTSCKDAFMWGDTLLVVTDIGIFVGDKKNNLQDVTYWNRLNFDINPSPQKVVCFHNLYFVLCSNGLIYSGKPGNWSLFLSDASIKTISVQDDKFIACGGYSTYIYDQNLQPLVVGSGANQVALNTPSNTMYSASGNKGLVQWSYNGSSFTIAKDSIIPNGPNQNSAWFGIFKEGVFYTTAGGRWTNRYFIDANISKFDNEDWYDLSNNKDLNTKLGFNPTDFLNIAIDPVDSKHFFVTSWGDGLFEYRKDTFYMRYNEKNSPINPVIPGRFSRVDGATFDADGNLWMLNSKYLSSNSTLLDSSLLILKPDGTWLQPFYSSLKASPTWNSILFTSNGQIWMNSARGIYGIFVLNTNETLEDLSDDQTKYFNSFLDQDENLFSPWKIKCITEDLYGSLWIGTNLGPLLATGVTSVFENDYRFTRIKIPRNDGTDGADYLLNNVEINCISVDGANRKWIGTEGQGVYLMSGDGLKTVYHFDNENSPLPSNVIWSISVNPETGEVFFGTEEGLVSFRSNATESFKDLSSVHVFPNPVKSDFNGEITVAGLSINAQIRITDVAGNTMVSGRSLGGQFGWNGYTSNGKKAASGVYLVFSATEDGQESQVCKFMIVR